MFKVNVLNRIHNINKEVNNKDAVGVVLVTLLLTLKSRAKELLDLRECGWW